MLGPRDIRQSRAHKDAREAIDHVCAVSLVLCFTALSVSVGVPLGVIQLRLLGWA